MENFRFLTTIGQYFRSTIDFIKNEIIKFFSKFKQIKDDEEIITEPTKRRKSNSINPIESELPDEENISLIIAFEEIEVAMNLFLCNEFLEAKELLSLHKDSSMYHSLVYSVIACFEVMLGYDKAISGEISLLLQQCIKLSDNPKQKVFSLRKKSNNEDFNNLNDFKIHGKLCSNEALLIGSLLTYLEQRVHSGVLKGTSNIANCYSGYRRCETILNKRTTWYAEECKLRFQNGICFGLGVFHLMVTFLPHNVIRLLEIVGYGGTKEKGLEYLKTGCDLPGYHKSLCALMLLGYNLYTLFEFTYKFGDLEQCNTVLENILELHPNSVWFLLTKAKYEMEIGDLDNALNYYLQAKNEQKSWLKFNILCYFDMLYIYTLQLQWEEANVYAGYIIDEGNISSTTVNYYIKAISLYMIPIKQEDDIIYWMEKASLHIQNNVAAPISIEKFVIHRSQRFFKQNNTLVLPAIEFIYMKNYFKIFEKNHSIASNVLDLIENELKTLEEEDRSKYAADNKALVLLLKGSCLRHIGSHEDALKCLNDAIALKNLIQEDNFLIPYAMAEIGFLYDQQENYLKAIEILEKGPMAHDQPTYASVPGIRVFGMMCVKPGYSVRKPSAQPPKRYQLQKPYYIPSTQNKYSIIKDNRPSSSSSSSNGYQSQSQPQIHDSYQLQHQANYQYLNRPESSPIISSGANTHKDYSDIQINHFSPGGNSGSVYGRNNERKTSSIVAEDSSDTIESDQETIENSTGSDIENQDDKPINRERRSILNHIDSISYNDDQMPEFPWNKVMEFQSSLVWEE